MLALAFPSVTAGREFKAAEVLPLAVALTAMSSAFFSWGLGIPNPVMSTKLIDPYAAR
jgi:hypothetical protein